MVRCDVCRTDVPDGVDALEIHKNGKKHVRAQATLDSAVALAASSVFVRDTDKKPLDIQGLKELFAQRGKILRVLWKSDAPDHAVFEFEDATVANAILDGKEVKFGEATLSIAPRKINFKDVAPEPVPLDCAAVLEDVLLLGAFDEQLDHSILKTGLSSEDIEKRQQICLRLQTELSKYFVRCEVRLFGSSITDLGILSSDMDATILFPEHDIPNWEEDRNKETLLTSDGSVYIRHRINHRELHKLSVQG
ncbi:unnamed protein product, partial [Mesorhabditis spiculigera]